MWISNDGITVVFLSQAATRAPAATRAATRSVRMRRGRRARNGLTARRSSAIGSMCRGAHEHLRRGLGPCSEGGRLPVHRRRRFCPPGRAAPPDRTPCGSPPEGRRPGAGSRRRSIHPARERGSSSRTAARHTPPLLEVERPPPRVDALIAQPSNPAWLRRASPAAGDDPVQSVNPFGQVDGTRQRLAAQKPDPAGDVEQEWNRRTVGPLLEWSEITAI